jgi:hypothetical protein
MREFKLQNPAMTQHRGRRLTTAYPYLHRRMITFAGSRPPPHHRV